MSTTLDGTGIFTDNAENQGIVQVATFDANAVNSGTVTTTAEFSGNAANHGEIVQSAVFAGNAVNTGTVAVAVFKDTATNAGTITMSAAFADTTTNSGVVSGAAVFTGSAVNNGGTIAGDAIFADTTTNNGVVQGNAQVAQTATNSGTVQGDVTEYVPPAPTLYSQIGGLYYSYDQNIINGTSVLRNSDGSIASNIAGLADGTGYYDFTGDGFGRPWSTDGAGVITWIENRVEIDYLGGVLFYNGEIGRAHV